MQCKKNFNKEEYCKINQQQTFDWYKKNYYDFSQKNLETHKFERALPHLKLNQNKNVMDIGCSKGFFSFLFSKKVKHIFAVDYESLGLKIAQKYKDENDSKYRNVSFHEMDATKLSKINNTPIHLMTCFDFFEHITNTGKKDFLKSSHKILKETEGLLMIYTPNYIRLRMEYFINKFKRALKWEKYGWQEGATDFDHQDTLLHIGLISRKNAFKMLKNNGFKIISENTDEYNIPLFSKFIKKKPFKNIFITNLMIFCKPQ